jgi:hypothetical protein
VGNLYCKTGGSLFCGFVDITKAFDSLEYREIWEKLEKINCETNIANMLKEQYQNQMARVVWEGTLSNQFKVSRGVRQGSPLSPFLFAIVLDEVVEKIQEMKEGCEFKGHKINIIAYADDIVILGPTRHAIEKLLTELTNKLKGKGLDVNFGKTVLMEIFKKRKKERKCRITTIGENEVKWVQEVMFLGIIIQSDFKWGKHIKKVGSKMNKLGNMVLHQVGKVVGERDRLYLLETCALDLYGIEFCGKGEKKLLKEVGKSYHWLIKRALGYSKYKGNHIACAEGGILTWELQIAWREFNLWEQIKNTENGLIRNIFAGKSAETELGEKVVKVLNDYRKEVSNGRDFKRNCKMYVEAMAVLKELEKEERA